MPNLSLNEKDFLKNSLKSKLRLDGRGLLDHRNISISFGLTPGSVELSLGDTKLQSKITYSLEEPRKERPNEGFLKFKVDLSILNYTNQSSSIYDTEKYSNEISKLLDKIIKGSKALDVESLCVLSGKCVWSIQIDLSLLNNDGNLIDAFYLSAILSLLHFRKPHISVENMNKIILYSEEEKKPHPLSIHHIPIAFTFAFFNNSSELIMDPTKLEEEVMDGRITFAVNIYKDICYIHKPGGASLSPTLFPHLLEVCNLKANQITKIIRDVLKDSEKYTIKNLKEKTMVKLEPFKIENNEQQGYLINQLPILQEAVTREQTIIDEELKETLESSTHINKADNNDNILEN